MKLNGLHHINIRCAESDLPAIEKFYGEVLGLRKGDRPNFPNPGIWLWQDNHPLVHVSARCVEGFLQDKHHGSVDHVAFGMNGAAEFRDRVEKLGIPYDAQNVPDAGFQIFLKDPIGTVLEFNFPNSEAPVDVTTGTLSKRQREMAGAR
jgi:catechol 2,3-dioxygenase-like lactoylglutathione lyase family enzyme